jgi:nitrogen fixation/metabolism regulation signal transduction histidine kinase
MAHTARLLCLVGFLPYVFAIIISAQMMMRSVDHYCPALFFFLRRLHLYFD